MPRHSEDRPSRKHPSWHILFLGILFFCALFFSFATFGTSSEADTRGVLIKPVAPTGEQVPGRQWLFAIGIDTYIEWPRLTTAVKDAQSMRDVLLERYHFSQDSLVELYNEEGTRKNIIEKFRFLAQNLTEDDSLVIFYAGHGHLDPITKEGSWVPVESGINDAASWISNDTIKNYLRVDAIKTKHILLVSDSCFSGDFFRGHRGALPEVTDEVIRKAYTLTSRQAITSGGLEPVSDAGFGGNSVFSHFFVQALKENQKPYLIASDLYPLIRSGVAENASQFPQLGSLHDTGGNQGGELVFFLMQDARLEGLGNTMTTRQQELERLQQMEKEAEATRQKEATEIAARESKLAQMNTEIEAMKSRLGTSEIRTNDSLDTMLAMVRQKEDQEKKLDELRKQREEEERKRQEEINRLKRERDKKVIAALKPEVEKYKEIVNSKFGSEMKASAWQALLAKCPSGWAEGVKEGEADSLLLSPEGRTRKKIEEAENARKAREVRAFQQGCQDFIETRVHDLQTDVPPNTDFLVFFAAGTPGGTCSGSTTIVQVASNRSGPWTSVGQRENLPRSGRDDTIHSININSHIGFRYVSVTTPKCYTDCSAVAVGLSAQEAQKKVNFPRQWE